MADGKGAGVVLRRARPIEMPTIAFRALSRRAHVTRHRQILPFQGLRALHVRSCDERLLPLQVDGDYIGELDRISVRLAPGALLVVS